MIPTSEMEHTIEKIEFTNLYICYRIRALISANFATTQTQKCSKTPNLQTSNLILMTEIKTLSFRLCLYMSIHYIVLYLGLYLLKSKIVFLYFGKILLSMRFSYVKHIFIYWSEVETRYSINQCYIRHLFLCGK